MKTPHIHVDSLAPRERSESSWLPDDELTQDWVRLVQQFRAECDAADRARLDKAPEQGGELDPIN